MSEFYLERETIHNESNVLPAPLPFLRRFQSLHAGFHRGKLSENQCDNSTALPGIRCILYKLPSVFPVLLRKLHMM